MKVFLLKVDDVFEIKSRGLILAPTIPTKANLPKSANVSLIRPDRSVIKTKAQFEVPFLIFSRIEDFIKHIPAYVCILTELEKKSVPIETEVWLD